MNIREIINSNLNGSTFISIDTCTPVTLKGGKGNLLQGRVTKVVTGSNVMLFQNKSENGYNNMVRRRLEAEGKSPDSFQLSPRQWGEREVNSPFVTHKGKEYLEVIFLSAGDVQYYVDGRPHNGPIEGLELNKPEGHQGGLEDKVIIRTYTVEHIQAITINHERYVRFPLVGFVRAEEAIAA